MVAVALVFLPRVGQVFLPYVPEPSPTFDCDDGTLLTYRYFRSLGIESTPVVGNLKMEGEAYADSDHVWLLVESGGQTIAYDWGTPRFDVQHYEGYPISLEYLQYAVAEDDRSRLAVADAESKS